MDRFVILIIIGFQNFSMIRFRNAFSLCYAMVDMFFIKLLHLLHYAFVNGINYSHLTYLMNQLSASYSHQSKYIFSCLLSC